MSKESECKELQFIVKQCRSVCNIFTLNANNEACTSEVRMAYHSAAKLLAIALSSDSTTMKEVRVVEIREPYYHVKCKNCGWDGSSEECPHGEDWFTCPKCHIGEPEEMDSILT